jgi:hypothetical protein
MLSDEERDFVRLGALAEELKKHDGWSAYVRAVAMLRESYVPRALARGDSDYEKGAVFAMDLVLTCLDATIERRKELLERERALGGDSDEAAPQVETSP